MKRNSFLNDLMLVSGAPGLILLALLFDTILRTMATPTAEQQVPLNKTVVFMAPLFALLVMLALVGVIWMFLANRGYGRVVPLVYTVLGLILLYSTAVLFVTPAPDSWYILVLYLAPDTLAFQASAAVAALGLVTLWFWEKPTEESDEGAFPSLNKESSGQEGE